MSLIKPFRALRPVSGKAKQVSCVPYDVAHEAEVREFIGVNPDSFLRVTRPEAELNGGERDSPDIVHDIALRNLRQLVDEGVLIEDKEPSFYVYRLTSASHTQTGVVACCSLDEYEKNLIKKHEKTRPDKVRDRTEHMLALRAQTGLIFLTFRGTERIAELIAETSASEPIYDFTCSNGIGQTVWRAVRMNDLADAFLEVPALYIADGHHRIESASAARTKLRAANPMHTGEEDYNFVLSGIFPAEELKILPYNRAVHDLNGLSEERLLAKLDESFTVEQNGISVPVEHGRICMYLGGRWYSLTFRAQQPVNSDPIERLDVSILQNHILRPILGIEDARTNDRIEFVGGIRGTGELERLVDSGTAKVAFSLYPTTMDDLLAVSDMGAIMPPKSTWFEPKLKDGLFVHKI